MRVRMQINSHPGRHCFQLDRAKPSRCRFDGEEAAVKTLTGGLGPGCRALPNVFQNGVLSTSRLLSGRVKRDLYDSR